jgi:hypothetical protein
MSLFSGFCTLVSLLFGEWPGAAIGAIVLTCGITTLRNRQRLQRGDGGGMVWLLRAQLGVLLVVALYVAQNLLAFDAAALMENVTPEMRTVLSESGLSVADLEPFLRPVYFGFYLTVLSGTLLFQGGLALFYHLRRSKVADELAARSA